MSAHEMHDRLRTTAERVGDVGMRAALLRLADLQELDRERQAEPHDTPERRRLELAVEAQARSIVALDWGLGDD